MALDAQLKLNIEKTLADNPMTLFMKGNPESPACGFSAQAIAILNELGAAYHTVDILQDRQLREGLKEFSNWPTYPQLYIKGELVGGSDLMVKAFESGELKQKITL